MARDLILVLGDQLDLASAALDDVDPRRDVVVMIEAAGEATKVWSHQARIALFLAAMRHHAEALRARGLTVDYVHLDAPGHTQTLGGELTRAIARHRPARVIVVEPGEHDVAAELTRVAAAAAVPLEVRVDRHFLCSREDFTRHCQGRSSLRLEYFYRAERRRHRVLLEDDDQPVGGQWNFDADNRSGFGKAGPGLVPRPRSFAPDAITREVLALVARRFGDHPGSLAGFDWPVTAADATAALDDFIAHRLPQFGTYQDAMWTGQPVLYHARIAAAMNLKLIAPRPIVDAAVAAHRAGRVSLAATEGFVRQILGWREYVRGVYWRFMPSYRDRNALGATGALPRGYWTGDSELACVRAAVGQTLALGYAHHIQRLMVTGLYALLLGVRPQEVHAWYLAIYVDAVEWVELPNTLGMSQYADGGVMASKPYVASGKYLARMSDYCRGCAFDPGEATGPRACPITTLYWDFLARHREHLAGNPRMSPQLRNLVRLDREKSRAIAAAAAAHKAAVGV
jgi:deoxyribodipyrimidine photolyase-related protein